MKRFIPLLILLVAIGCDTPRPAERQLPTEPAAVTEVSYSSGSAAMAQGPAQVTLCHKPGTPAEQTLTLPEPAVAAHLRHGDRLGACGLPPGAFACPVARIVVGEQGPQATLVFQDTGPGLLYLTVTAATNVTVDIPAFDPATADPVVVTATRIDPAQTATFQMFVRLDTESTSSARFCSYEL